MNCRNSSTPTHRTWGWLKTGLLGAAFALFGTTQAQVTVTATGVGPGPTVYATVNAAFAAINAGTHQGAITVNVTASTTEPAPATPLLASGGASSYTSILLTCTGNVTVNSAATPTASRGIIELVGADNVTIDGDDPGTGGIRNLTFQMVTTTTAGTQCIRLASNSTTGLDGANNNTVRNCNLVGGRSSATVTTTSWGILMSNSTAVTTGAYSSLNTLIENNAITRCYTGIGAIGVSATYMNAGTIIRDNVLGSATSADNIGSRGILISYTASTAGVGSATIRNNDIRVGDYGATGFSATIAGIEVGTVNAGLIIDRNNIHDINQPSTSGYGAHGIYVTGATTTAGVTITNNFIRDCKMVVYQTSKTSTFIPCGVFFTAGATLVNFDHNTISMGTQLGAGVNFSSFAMNSSVSGVTFASFRNNILRNTHVSTNAYGFNTAATTNISGGSVNNNDYYVPGGHVGFYNALNQTTLGAWQTATGKDGASINLDGPFVSATDLHVDLANPAASSFNGTGASGTGVANDYDNDARGTPPDIGADEFILLQCASANGGTISPASQSACAGGTKVISSTGADVGLGITYQWEVSSTGGGAGFADVSGGSGATSTSYTTGTLSTGTLYYRLRVTCSAGPIIGYSNELTLTVNPVPVATAGSNSPICAGSALNLTGASDIGGSSFSWTGPLAYTNGTQSPQVSASATTGMSGTYVLTATAAGCSSTPSNTVVVVDPGPTGVTANASAGMVCPGGTVDLTSTGVAPQLPILTEDFNGAVAGWTTTNTSTGGTPANAAWGPRANGFTYLTAPLGGTFSSNDASTFYMTNSDAQGSGGTTATTLVSPVFSLVGYTAASANFFYFYRDIGDTGDSAVVETSTNGTTWAIAQAFVATTGLPAGFVSASVPLTSVLGQATVQVRFRYKGTWDYYWCVDNFSVNAASAPTFAWAGSPGGYSSAVQNPTGVPVTAPSTTYTVTVTAANSCTATANTTVNVGSGSPPDVTIAAGGPTTFCSGGSVLLTASITDGCPAFTYVWSDGMNTVGTNSPTYSATASGTYSVSITDASSQTDVSNSIVVTVNPTPVATAGSNSPVCIGQPLDLTGSSSEGGSSFSWTGPLAYTDGTQNPQVSASATAGMAGTYVLTATAAGCPSAPSNTVVVVNANPVIVSTTATPGTICPGGSSQLLVTTPAPSGYCTTISFATSIEPISNVTFAGINNSSPCPVNAPPTNALQDFTGVVGNVVAGGVYPFTASGNTDGSFTTYFTAFFDWDQNGTFESQQAIGSITNTACILTATNNVTVPAGAFNGNTRMRVVKNYFTSPTDPCGAYSYGQAEDYTINVTGGVAPYTYSWTNPGTLNDATIANPMATIMTANTVTNYQVTVSANGCSAQGNTSVTTPLVDDGDPCTLDQCTGNGNVSHTFQDSDLDGICDANDDCPNLFGEQGDACDDGNANTSGDVINGSCVCQGLLTDCLGVPGGPALPGTPCDDLDANTGNDVYQPNCTCAGQPFDCLGVPGGTAVIGSPCDDGNATTGNDIYQPNCTCAGQTLDCEGTPGGTELPGTPCDDGLATTGNDTWSAGCVCEGQLIDCLGVPGGPALPGTACDDGNATTGNDVYQPNCTCAGQTIDCLGVPGGTALPGTACNDGNPNTINDLYQPNCTCAGTPVGGCALNEVILTLNTDANAAQTTWNIVNGGTSTVVCSGGGYANNSLITATCCLPNGCYDLQVFDSMGDGINPGGFVLRDINTNRIIDNANNGNTFTSLSKAAPSFCVPLGTDALTAGSCDQMSLPPNGTLTAVVNPAVSAQYNLTNSTSGYQWHIFNPHGGYTRMIFLAHNTGGGPNGATKCATLKLADIVTLPVPQNVVLNVRVRSRVAGTYAAWGGVCRMRVGPPPCATTKLVDDINNPNYSCGVTRTFGGSQYISAITVPGVNKYQFKFDRVGGGYTRTIAVTGPNLTLNWNTLPLVAGNTYNVVVRVSYDGGSTYCPYGASCTVAIVAPPVAQARTIEVEEMEQISMQLYPNPNRDGLVTVRMDVLKTDIELVSLDVTDLFGKRVHAEQLPVSGTLNSTLDLSGLASGVYVVTLTAGSEQWNQRLVIQR